MMIKDEDCLTETLAFNERFAADAGSPVRRGAPDATMLAALRRNRLGGDTPPVRLPHGHDRVLAGGVRIRTFVPPRVDGVYLHIHGGGWAFGSADGQDDRLWRLARDARLAVVSVEYRLAPEHPFPAGPDDCETAARWLVENAEAEFGTRRLLIGGESAGSPGDRGVRSAVESALSANTALRLSYLDAGGRASVRVVEPAGLLTAEGRWYLIAWCRTRRAGRGFRLDRIATAQPLAEQAEPRDLAALLRGSAATSAGRPATLDALAPAP